MLEVRVIVLLSSRSLGCSPYSLAGVTKKVHSGELVGDGRAKIQLRRGWAGEVE